MAIHSIVWDGESIGLILYAFPLNQSLAAWDTYSVELVEENAPDAGKYIAELDDANGDNWAVFEGEDQPSDWVSDRHGTISVSSEFAAIDEKLPDLDATAKLNAEAFFALNTGGRTIDDLTTPKNLEVYPSAS